VSGDDATGWRRTPLPPPAVATRRHGD